MKIRCQCNMDMVENITHFIFQSEVFQVIVHEGKDFVIAARVEYSELMLFELFYICSPYPMSG